ncbi:MAG: hypothetical protein LBH19_13300 [Dysgonamonadaceae bacterium]|jgi:hypothetical protein|nr:hypothetical protein [Dysgonamonadaceae bacterium]
MKTKVFFILLGCFLSIMPLSADNNRSSLREITDSWLTEQRAGSSGNSGHIGDERPKADPDVMSPIGDSIWVLCLVSAGYALLIYKKKEARV